jgi:GntR family transcriptional regulator
MMANQSLGVSSKVPDRIYDHVKEKIQTGVYHPGEKIPSEPDLVNELRVSRNSLREAITRLEHEGYLVKKHGIGTFVMNVRVDKVNAAIDKLYSTSQLIASQGMTPGTTDLSTILTQADEFVAEKLEIPPQTPVVRIQRKRTADGKSFCWDDSYFPVHPCLLDLDELQKSISLMDYVEKNLDIKIDRAIASLRPAISDEFISKVLDIPIGSLMYLVEQVHYLSNTVPIWYSRVWYPEEVITVKILVTW